MPVLALLFYAGAYLTISFQQGMAALREEQATHYAEYQQTQEIRARIREAEQFYTRIRRLKHEMRGHLTNIKGLARSGEYSSLEDYIARMDESISDFELTLQTGNPVTDVIVNDIRRRSLDLNIRFQSDFHYPEPGAYDAFDIGIILQNLLQNAVEACEKVCEGQRFIKLTGKRKGRFFLIEVKNTFMGEVLLGKEGFPVTTKSEDVPMHGIGLANVRREAEKYMGELELKTNQREFSATVLLQERSSL
jgi:sensor histidine kinase regulating citrate/malate metabolism